MHMLAVLTHRPCHKHTLCYMHVIRTYDVCSYAHAVLTRICCVLTCTPCVARALCVLWTHSVLYAHAVLHVRMLVVLTHRLCHTHTLCYTHTL